MKKNNSVKADVSSSYTLLQMKHDVDRDVSKRTKLLWHLQDDAGVGQMEYTVCGKAWTDSQMASEGWEYVMQKRGGKITCPLCLQVISWMKGIQ